MYAPDISKERRVIEEIHTSLDQITATDKIISIGDLNGRIGNEPVIGVIQRFNENLVNGNGDLLTTFCAVNSMGINNTFFEYVMSY